MHIEIATKTSGPTPGLQLQAFYVPSLTVSKNADTGRAWLSVSRPGVGMGPSLGASLETWEAYDAVLDRMAQTPTGEVLRISSEDLSAAEAEAGG